MDLGVLRKSSGKSQAEIAQIIGITRAAYSNIENGKRRPSVEVAKRIAAALGFEWTRFYEDGAEQGKGESQ